MLAQIKKWRRDLHRWDPQAEGGEAAQPLVAALPPPPPPPGADVQSPAAHTPPAQVGFEARYCSRVIDKNCLSVAAPRYLRPHCMYARGSGLKLWRPAV